MLSFVYMRFLRTVYKLNMFTCRGLSLLYSFWMEGRGRMRNIQWLSVCWFCDCIIMLSAHVELEIEAEEIPCQRVDVPLYVSVGVFEKQLFYASHCSKTKKK